MARDKYRIRFSKGGDLRLVSHHDLMRCFERLLRRAAIPFLSTGQFHPTPRIIFALSLPLGVSGCREVVEVELSQPMEPGEFTNRLISHAPPGIVFGDIRRIAPKTTARPRRLVYRLPFASGPPASLAERCAHVLAQNEILIERSHPSPRQVNLRLFIRDLCLTTNGLEMDLWISAAGTARPEEIFSLLGISDPTLSLERLDLELEDEVGPDAETLPEIPVPARQPPHTRKRRPPIRHTIPELALQPNNPPSALWGASPHGPIVE